MAQTWKGPLIAGTIILGMAAILVANLQTGRSTPPDGTPASGPRPGAAKPGGAPSGQSIGRGAPEHPIGDEVVKNHLQVVAVWLAAVAMEGMETPGAADLIHLEADIRAAEENLNGFAKDEFVPYLKVTYAIVPAKGGPPVARGDLIPMVAWDGLHYGANLVMPRPGDYKLVYDIQPPSAGGLGRHSDHATGVAPWWPPFQATFDWTVEPVTATAKL